jgi:anti-sigma factor ChrR (cupin superfamily)
MMYRCDSCGKETEILNSMAWPHCSCGSSAWAWPPIGGNHLNLAARTEPHQRVALADRAREGRSLPLNGPHALFEYRRKRIAKDSRVP